MSLQKSLLQNSTIIAIATLFSRILGLSRDIVIAHLFGASMALDAFLIAFKLPNFLRRLFAEGAFAQGFIPVLVHAKNPKQQISELAGGLILFGGALTLLVEIFAPFWVKLFAPGFLHQEFQLTVSLLRITFPFLFFVLLTALASAILNTHKYFALPALAPAWLNITTLAAAIGLTPYLAIPITALAWGVLAGGIMQCIFLLPAIAKLHLLTWPRWRNRGIHITRTLTSMLPAVIAVSAGQLTLIIDVMLASFLPAGSISFLFYSDRLISFPIALISVAVSSAVLPALAKSYNKKETQSFEQSLSWGVRMIAVLGLPAAMGLILLAGPIIATLLKSGHFNAHDVVMTKNSLIAFACGTPALMFIKILGAACNAHKKSYIPCGFVFIVLVINGVLGWWWMHFAAHVGLAWASAVAVNINALLLWMYCKKSNLSSLSNLSSQRKLGPSANGEIFWIPAFAGMTMKFYLQLFIAMMVMICWLTWQTPVLEQWLAWPYFTRWLHLMWLILSAVGIYTITLAATGFRRNPHK